MSKFIRNLSLFVASLPLMTTKSLSAVPGPKAEIDPLDPTGPVPLRPLNLEADNLFAGHRSHSSHWSHSSHSSHYSGSGGGSSSYRAPAYVAPSPAPAPSYVQPAPAPAPTPSRAASLHETAPGNATNRFAAPGSTARPGQTVPGASAAAREELTHPEKIRLQIMRVPIKLRGLGLYDGPVDGVMNEDTRRALRYFQDLKGLQKTGTMTTPTLNAMGIPAVN